MVKKAANTKEHICLLCEMGTGCYTPDCGGVELAFGDGYGMDNIIGCDAFEAFGGVPESGWREGNARRIILTKERVSKGMGAFNCERGVNATKIYISSDCKQDILSWQRTDVPDEVRISGLGSIWSLNIVELPFLMVGEAYLVDDRDDKNIQYVKI